jgi:hypothetical protein
MAVGAVLILLSLVLFSLGTATAARSQGESPVAGTVGSPPTPRATDVAGGAGGRPTTFAPDFTPRTGNAPQPSATGIDPYEYYSDEPAPMGIADWGVTAAGGGAYSYTTPAVRGTMTFFGNPEVANASLGSSSPYFGVQLNVMLVFDDSAGTQYTYWVQDVALYNTTSDQVLFFVDNIWNDSASGSQMTSSSVSGNGTVSSSAEGGFYNDETTDALPGGTDTPLAAPDALTLEMDSFQTDTGAPGVAFLYTDGFGPIAFDVVDFPWATNAEVDYGFVVDGAATTPVGEPYDLELVFGGPGGGSQTSDLLSDLLFTLWYFNGDNFQTPQNAFNFGGETAEGASNVFDYGVYIRDDGNLSGLLVNGTVSDSVLSQLYNYTIVSDLIFTDGTENGSLSINGVPTPFYGGVANLTLYPGSYYVNVTLGGTTVPLGICTLTAESVLEVSLSSPCAGGTPPAPLSIVSFDANPATSTVGESVTFAVVTSGGDGTLGYVYVGLPPSCRTSDAASITCAPSAAGTYTVTVWVNSSIGQSTSQSLSLTVTTTSSPLSIVSFTVSSGSVTAGQPVTFTVAATGGAPPYSYRYSDLPTGCTTSDSDTLTCSPQVAGTYTVDVTVTDSDDATASGAVGLSVTPGSGTTAPGGGAGSSGAGTLLGLSDFVWIALVVVVVVLLVALFAVRSRRHAPPASGYPAAGYAPTGYPPGSQPPAGGPPPVASPPPPRVGSPPPYSAYGSTPPPQVVYAPPPAPAPGGAPIASAPPYSSGSGSAPARLATFPCPRCGQIRAWGPEPCPRCGSP